MGTYDSVKVNQGQADRLEHFRLDFQHLSEKAAQTVKPGRLLSLAQTKLEEAAMFLNKAIAHDGLIDDDSDGA